MAAYATPTRMWRRTWGFRLLGVWIREVMEDFVYDPEFHEPLGSLETLASPNGSLSLCKPCSLLEPPQSLPQRSSQSEGTCRTFGAVRPSFVTGSTLVFSSEMGRQLGRTLCFRTSTVPVRPWKRSTLRPIIPPEPQKSPEEASEHVRKCPSWEAIRLRWPRAVATNLACIVKTKRDDSVKIRLVIDLRRSGVNGLTPVPRKVILPQVKDFAVLVVDPLWRPTAALH